MGSVSVFLSRFWLSKWHPKILQWHPKFWKPGRYGFALYWSKTIWGKHVFLHVAISTAAVMISRHNSLAQKLKAEIIRIVSVHCYAHRLTSACCYTAADLYSVRKCESTLMQLWKCLLFPLRSAFWRCIRLQWRQKVGSCNAHAKQSSCRVWQLWEIGVRFGLLGRT